MKTKPCLARPTWRNTVAGRLRTASAPRLLPVLLLALPSVAGAQYDYSTNNGTVTITGYTGSGGSVAIPLTINGLPVTNIGDWAFFDSMGVTSVTIPDSVTSLGIRAFSGCTSLTNITIGNSVTNIGEYTFANDRGLTSVTIPTAVTSIGSFTSMAALA